MASLRTVSGMKMVEKLYPNLNLSSIVPPGSEEGDTEEEATPTQNGTPTMPVDQAIESAPEQKNRDGDED